MTGRKIDATKFDAHNPARWIYITPECGDAILRLIRAARRREDIESDLSVDIYPFTQEMNDALDEYQEALDAFTDPDKPKEVSYGP